MNEPLFHLEPEVDGASGNQTIMENTEQFLAGLDPVHKISRLHSKFNEWRGDDLIRCLDYLVSDDLGEALVTSAATGFRLDDVLVTKSASFKNRQKSRPEFSNLPVFRWLRLDGRAEILMDSSIRYWSGHDFAFASRVDFTYEFTLSRDVVRRPNCGLVVSLRCLDILKSHRLENCRIEELHWPDRK